MSMSKDGSRGHLTLTLRPDEWVRIITPSGEVVWVGLGRIDRGKAKVMFNSNKSAVILRDELLPAEEQFRATEGRD